jgi:hypothetical protein
LGTIPLQRIRFGKREKECKEEQAKDTPQIKMNSMWITGESPKTPRRNHRKESL